MVVVLAASLPRTKTRIIMNQIYQKCDICKGRGHVETFDFEHGRTGDGIGTNTAICAKCNGSGFIETDLFVFVDMIDGKLGKVY